MVRRRLFELLILTLLVSSSTFAFAQELMSHLPDRRPMDAAANERVIIVPGGPGLVERMETTLYRPTGPGPFPLLIMNHGKDPVDPKFQPRERFRHLARAFVQRGYAVMIPMRLGFSASSGDARFFGCDLTQTALAQAEDVVDVLRFAHSQPWIDRSRIVVAGQSLGGLVSMAVATKRIPGVRGIINFAGGLKDPTCEWQPSLERAFSEFGQKNQIPSLWLYGENDSLFGPDLVARLYTAFERAGGRARLFQYQLFKRDAHGMVAERDGELVWHRVVDDFLSTIGMPTQIVFDLPPIESPRETGFAPLQAVEAVPYLRESGRAAYREYLTKYFPRAFAISSTGDWAWAESGEDSNGRAIAACEAKANQPCQLYSVDQKVVWKAEAPSVSKR